MTDPAPADVVVDVAPTPPPLPDAGDPGQPLPQPEDQADHIDQSHLFGAALFGDAPAGQIMPVPVVAIGGAVVASGPDSSLSKPMVVDGLSVSWGRQEVMAQPDPATASLTCFDPSSTWPLTTDLRGRLVVISWQATRPSDGSLQTTAMFVGRITSAKLRRKTVVNSDGTKVHGLLVALTAASILNDLANRVPAEDWPDETMDARRARIATYAASVCTGGVTIRGYWKTPHVAPVALADQVSVLDHLLRLYESAGPDRMTFLPWSQQAIQLERRDMPAWRTTGSLHWNVAGEGTARDGKGAYAWSVAVGPYDGGMNGANHYLDGDSIEYPEDSTLSKDATGMITRVDVSHPDGAAANAMRVETTLCATIDPTIDETLMGVRTARLDSSVNWNSYAQQASSDLAFMAAREAAGWRTDPITIRTKMSNVAGFDYWSQAGLVLAGAEVLAFVFIQRSWFAQLGIRPCFALIGGTIRYRSGEWQAECELAPVNTLPAAQHAISWSEIDDGSSTYELQWWDEDNPRGLHESLTYEDIGFVGYGLGMTTVPADTGWDGVYPK
jgi:hypothetical protein